MTLKHYVKGRQERANTAAPIVATYYSVTDEKSDEAKGPKSLAAQAF